MLNIYDHYTNATEEADESEEKTAPEAVYSDVDLSPEEYLELLDFLKGDETDRESQQNNNSNSSNNYNKERDREGTKSSATTPRADNVPNINDGKEAVLFTHLFVLLRVDEVP